MAADRAVGLITRAQMLAATERANIRLGEIAAEMEHAARENVLAPLVAAEDVTAMWEDTDLSLQRAVIKTLMTITLLPPRQGRAAGVRPGHGPGHLAAAVERLIVSA